MCEVSEKLRALEMSETQRVWETGGIPRVRELKQSVTISVKSVHNCVIGKRRGAMK